MSGIPDSPESIALIVWIAALAAGYDSGNRDRVSAVLDLFSKSRRAVDDERQPHPERGLVQ